MKKPRLKKILVYVNPDGAEQYALDRAVKLVQAGKVALKVVAVCEEPSWVQKLVQAKWPVERYVEQEAREKLESLVAPLRKKGVRVTTAVLKGTPFIAVIRDVLDNHHDLVMKTAEPDGHRAFSSTGWHLIRKCPCPVWLVRPKISRARRRILAAVDATPDADSEETFNRKIIGLSAFVADLVGAELHIVHAWRPYGEATLYATEGVRNREIEEYVAEIGSVEQDAFKRLLSGTVPSIDRRRTHILRGLPSEVIPALASEKKIDTIVMGTVSRTGIPGLLIGNTAEQIINRIESSLLAVKPDGFVSLVRAPHS